jgi:DNA-binding transcriptional MerR regulator
MQTTGDVTKQFGVSRQTVSNWCHEFARFLSPTANPPLGAQRRFTDDDLKVFAVVHRQKRGGLTYEEISAALASGEREDPPTDIATTTNAAMERLQQRVITLENQLRETEHRLAESDGMINELRRQLDETKRALQEAYKTIGRLEG